MFQMETLLFFLQALLQHTISAAYSHSCNGLVKNAGYRSLPLLDYFQKHSVRLVSFVVNHYVQIHHVYVHNVCTHHAKFAGKVSTVSVPKLHRPVLYYRFWRQQYKSFVYTKEQRCVYCAVPRTPCLPCRQTLYSHLFIILKGDGGIINLSVLAHAAFSTTVFCNQASCADASWPAGNSGQLPSRPPARTCTARLWTLHVCFVLLALHLKFRHYSGWTLFNTHCFSRFISLDFFSVI